METPKSIWQHLKYNDRMRHLLTTGHLSDCSFSLSDENGEKVIVKCHKFVLISSSPVFERMFEGDFEEARLSGSIVLDDVRATDFKKFIEFLYCNDTESLESYHIKILQSLIYLSNKYMVPSLTKSCINIIQHKVESKSDAIALFEYAHHIENTDLIECICELFMNDPMTYLTDDAVFDLSSAIFYKFINLFDNELVNEIYRFDAIDRYCNIHGLVIDPKEPEKHVSQSTSDAVVALKEEESGDLSSLTVKKMDENDKAVEVLSEEEKLKQKQLNDKSKEKLKQKEFINSLLDTVDFSSMSAYDFCSGPGRSPLLSLEKKFEIISGICMRKTKLTPRNIKNVGYKK